MFEFNCVSRKLCCLHGCRSVIQEGGGGGTYIGGNDVEIKLVFADMPFGDYIMLIHVDMNTIDLLYQNL